MPTCRVICLREADSVSSQGSGNGGVLFIESTSMPGHGTFELTGQLGDVISESAHLAFAWVKSHAYELGISAGKDEDVFKNINIHLHLPSGSIKKDGPSAGVAMVVAMVSLSKLPSRRVFTDLQLMFMRPQCAVYVSVKVSP